MNANVAIHELERARGRRYIKYAEDFQEWWNDHEAYDVEPLGASLDHLKTYLRHLRDNTSII